MYRKDRALTDGGPGRQDIFMFLNSGHALHPYYLFLKEKARQELVVAASPIPVPTRHTNVNTVNKQRTLAIKKLGTILQLNRNDYFNKL